jgi:hypothetical protein
MQAPKPGTKCYCNVTAMEKGLDPCGYAHDFDDAVVVEIPLPWKANMYHEAGVLPQEVIDLLSMWLQRYHDGPGYRHRPLMVAPDPAYSRRGYRRVMFYARQPGLFARFTKTEYLVPEAEVGALVWVLYEAHDELPRFEEFRDSAQDATRDLLVCTHGTVDAACAKFGYPLYNTLRQGYVDDHLRVWRVSHFGGHVFAPTMMDMPTGHYWAYVGDKQAEQIVRYGGDVRDLYGHYRGWAGLEDGFLQAAERELWRRYGWEWFSYLKSGHITAKDEHTEDPKWADIQIEFSAPNSIERQTYHARVEVRTQVLTAHGTDTEQEYSYPQYTVSEYEPVR